jgi:hypothetical protein
MRNRALNTLSYTGIVTLSQYVGNKKVKIARIHNTGGKALFEFLADCLAGNFSAARLKMPKKIKLLRRTRNDDESYSFSSVSGFIFLLDEAVSDSSYSQSKVTYSFLINRDQFDSIDDFNNLCLGLYTNNISNSDDDVENFAAYCVLENLDSSITNATLVVDWELNISNHGDSEITG